MAKENIEILEYIYRNMPDLLNSYKLFPKIFGNNFAFIGTICHIDKVISNSYKPGISGSYDILNHGIILNKNVETIEDIKNNNRMKHTILHETIHGILSKNEQMCKTLDIKSGTGLLETYNNENEVGRALNEGYTEWLCEKVGLPSNSYREFTEFIIQIECAIGEENTLKLGKGNINGNIRELLKMNSDEIYVYLGIADFILIDMKRMQDKAL